MSQRSTEDDGDADALDPTAGFATEHGLSERERQVLMSASLGRASKETAALLRCSRHTVDEYWARIFRKTGCRSQVAVLAKVLRQHIRDATDTTRPAAEADGGCGDPGDMTEGRPSR